MRYPLSAEGRPRLFGGSESLIFRPHQELSADLAKMRFCVVVQSETRLGLDNLKAIASVAGVDGVFIGSGDLAASLGHAGNAKHPEVLAAVETAISRIRACGKPAGILTGDEQLAHRYIELGCLFTAVGSDQALLARRSEELAARFICAGPRRVAAIASPAASHDAFSVRADHGECPPSR